MLVDSSSFSWLHFFTVSEALEYSLSLCPIKKLDAFDLKVGTLDIRRRRGFEHHLRLAFCMWTEIPSPDWAIPSHGHIILYKVCCCIPCCGAYPCSVRFPSQHLAYQMLFVERQAYM